MQNMQNIQKMQNMRKYTKYAEYAKYSENAKYAKIYIICRICKTSQSSQRLGPQCLWQFFLLLKRASKCYISEELILLKVVKSGASSEFLAFQLLPILKFSICMFCIGVEHLAVLKTLPLKCSVRGVDGGQLRLPCSICSQISEPSSLHYHLRAQNIPPPENLATLFSFQEYIGSVILRKLFRQVITNLNLETRSIRPTHQSGSYQIFLTNLKGLRDTLKGLSGAV